MNASRLSCCLGTLFLVLCCSACRRSPAAPVQEPPIVAVAAPLEREVYDFVDLTGRTAAPQSVDLRARVTGYLVSAPFREGALVKTGDLLFEIDPRPYQAKLDDARAAVGVAEAQLRLATADNERAKVIRKTNPGAISDQDLDKYQASQDQAAAQLDQVKANLANARLNLDFTKVTSPIDGQVSRYYLTPGNLINQDNTLLTTVVSQDPMYIYFDLDEPSLLRVARNLNDGGAQPRPLSERHVPVMLGLADEEGYPHKGLLDFAENQVDPSTGTLSVRGVFANTPMPNGVRLLRPGMFVRVRLPLGRPYQAFVVPDSALSSDQGSKYLLVVDDQGVVQYRSVKTGPLQEDGMRVIAEGLKGGEKVIVSGLQIVRPRMKVQTEDAAKAAATPAPSAPSA